MAFGSTDEAKGSRVQMQPKVPQIPLIHSLSSYPYLPHGYVGEMVGIALALSEYGNLVIDGKLIKPCHP